MHKEGQKKRNFKRQQIPRHKIQVLRPASGFALVHKNAPILASKSNRLYLYGKYAVPFLESAKTAFSAVSVFHWDRQECLLFRSGKLYHNCLAKSIKNFLRFLSLYPMRSRMKSYIMIDPATAAFSDSAPPRMGILSRIVHSASTAEETPWPSLPITTQILSLALPR